MVAPTIIKGNLLDIEYFSAQNLLVCTTHCAGLSAYGYVAGIFKKYPHANIIKDRRRYKQENWANKNTRASPGTSIICHPPLEAIQTSNNHQDPSVAVLFTQYGDFGPHPDTSDDFKVSHSDHEHKINLLHDTVEQRKVYFRLALINLLEKLRQDCRYEPLCNIRTVTFPYLCGTSNLSQFNRYYMEDLNRFANTLYVDTGIKTIIVMSKTISYIMRENKDIADYCYFTGATTNIHTCDNYDAYKVMCKYIDAVGGKKMSNKFKKVDFVTPFEDIVSPKEQTEGNPSQAVKQEEEGHRSSSFVDDESVEVNQDNTKPPPQKKSKMSSN